MAPVANSKKASVKYLGFSESFKVWVNAITHPSMITYRELADHPNATYELACWWIFLCSFIYVFLRQGIVIVAQILQNIPFHYKELLYIVFIPLASYMAFYVHAGITNLIARLFGGKNDFGELAFVYSSIYSPAILVLTCLMLVTSFIIDIGIIRLLLLLYILVLTTVALRTLHRLSWFRAICTQVISLSLSFILGFPLFGLISLLRYL